MTSIALESQVPFDEQARTTRFFSFYIFGPRSAVGRPRHVSMPGRRDVNVIGGRVVLDRRCLFGHEMSA